MERIRDNRDNLGLIFCPNWDPPILANWYVHNIFLTKILSEWFFARHGSILSILVVWQLFSRLKMAMFCLFLLVLLLSKGDQSVVWRVPNMSEWKVRLFNGQGNVAILALDLDLVLNWMAFLQFVNLQYLKMVSHETTRYTYGDLERQCTSLLGVWRDSHKPWQFTTHWEHKS